MNKQKEAVREQVIAGITVAAVYQCRPNTYVRVVSKVDGVAHTAVGFAKVMGCAIRARHGCQEGYSQDRQGDRLWADLPGFSLRVQWACSPGVVTGR